MKSENEGDFIAFDDDEIEVLVERHFDNAEEDDEPESSGSPGNNETAYRNTLDIVDKSEQIDADDSLSTAHLPVTLLNIVRDISKRDSISEEIVAVALFTVTSSVFSEEIQICQKRNDKSAVCSAVISPLILTDARSAQKISLKRILRSLLQPHNNLNYRPEDMVFDFNILTIDKRRTFSGSKIRLVRKNETGRIEAVFSEEAFELKGNTLNPENANFFVAVSDIELQSVVKNVDNASLLNNFLLLSPSRVTWKWSDMAIDKNLIDSISQIFARIHDAVKALSSESRLILHFSPEAQGVYFRFVENLKLGLDKSTAHPSVIAHIDTFDETFCKIALLLFLCESAAAGKPITSDCEVDLISAQRAFAWCGVLESHTRAVFLSLLSKNSVENLILQKIADGRLGESFTAREILRAQWGDLRSSSSVEVKKALDGLVEDGKLKVVIEKGIGRPTTRYEPTYIEEVEVDLDSETDESEDE